MTWIDSRLYLCLSAKSVDKNVSESDAAAAVARQLKLVRCYHKKNPESRVTNGSAIGPAEK